jgi:hypothetical protein
MSATWCWPCARNSSACPAHVAQALKPVGENLGLAMHDTRLKIEHGARRKLAQLPFVMKLRQAPPKAGRCRRACSLVANALTEKAVINSSTT